MITDHIQDVKAATFCVQLPNKDKHDFDAPAGTGFFISEDGLFITAAHVITQDGKPRDDLGEIALGKESFYTESGDFHMGPMCRGTEGLVYLNLALDIAILKVNFKKK